MRRTRLALAASVALLALTGCPPTYPKCNTDEHCKDHGEVCVQGQCQECATDQHCKEGFVCQGNKCVPKPECTQDADCGAKGKCRAGRCVEEVSQKPEGACTTNADCPSGQECVSGTCQKKAGPACDWTPVRFEFNEFRLTPEAQKQLDLLADCIKRDGVRVVLEGHADERGTEEYNLQLSNKRAASVKRYLASLGVAQNLLETVGFGENRPAASGSNEAAWAENRRVEFNRK